MQLMEKCSLFGLAWIGLEWSIKCQASPKSPPLTLPILGASHYSTPATMASLTGTTHMSTFTFPRPGIASVSLNESDNMDIAVPPGSNWSSGPNWHNGHAEHWKVLSGAVLVSVNNKSFVVTGGSPMITFPSKARHEVMRWDCPGRTGHQSAAQEAFRKEMLANGQSKELEKLSAQEVQAEQTTSPSDCEKEIFFRNVLSALSEPRNGIWGELLRLIHLVVIYQGLDAHMVIVDMGSEGRGWRAMVEEIVWWLVAGMANLANALFNFESVSEAYTPSPLMSQWREKKSE